MNLHSRTSFRPTFWCFWLLLLALLPCCSRAQQITLRARSNLVVVPTLVETKAGQPVFNLAARDFTVKDNGIPQKIHLDAESDETPMSIVVLVQVGRSAVREFHNMVGLPTMLSALAGNTRHRTAVVEFDSQPRMLLDFSSSPDAVHRAVYSVRPGDDGAAILDAVWYAVDMLQDEPPQNQRVIVLLSQTRDHGSRTPLKDVVRKIGRSDVVVYSLAFSPGRSDLLDFSHAGGNADLLKPLLMTIAALKKNTAAAIPHMTGGQYLRFNRGKQLDGDLGMLANQVHNRYVLSFQPSDPKPGLHALTVELNRPIEARVLARASYWAAAPPAVEQEEIPESAPPRDP